MKTIRDKKRIMIAEDSHMLRDLLVNTLHDAGYSNVVAYNDGKAVWDALTILAKRILLLKTKISMLITDIEMPQMDGHHLLKLVRENHVLEKLPVVIFSSLINEEMRMQG